MKLPVSWLDELLDGGLDKQALAEACQRWDIEPDKDYVKTLGHILTFSGFGLEEIFVEEQSGDTILDLEVLANRPDCQGVMGLAREVAAILRTKVKPPADNLAEGAEGAEGAGAASDLAQIEVRDPVACPRYTARIIRGVKVGPSPEWLRKRLRSMGLIPRNNIVDITNLILFEYNQPLHAFDLNRLTGQKIIVRRALDGEAFRPLYGNVPPLTSETLVIADAERPVAIGGVIGGEGTEVNEDTTDILLEAAYFQPADIRRTSRRLKVSTDSSYRFERGIDLEAVARVSARAAHLICELAGGTVAQGILDSNPYPRAEKELAVRHEKVRGVMGVSVPPEDAKAILTALGCEVRAESPEELRVKIPSWRRGDLEREIDLIEELARCHGYDKVPAETAMRARIPVKSPMEVAKDRVRECFTQLGYFECITDSLVDPRLPQPGVWSKENRLAMDARSVMREDHSELRADLLLSLLPVYRHNQNKRVGTIRLFETGKVFLPTEKNGQPEERPVLGLIDDLGFAHLHDAMERLSEALSLSDGHFKLCPEEDGHAPSFLAPESACRFVRVRELGDDERAEDAIGWIGELASALVKDYGLKQAPAVAEIKLEPLAAMASAPRRCRPLAKHPEVVRDVAIVVDEGVRWGEIHHFARQYQREEALRDPHEDPRFLSVFRGKQIGAGKKSVAFSVVYRAEDRSLTDDEVNSAHQSFVDSLCGAFSATVRS